MSVADPQWPGHIQEVIGRIRNINYIQTQVGGVLTHVCDLPFNSAVDLHFVAIFVLRCTPRVQWRNCPGSPRAGDQPSVGFLKFVVLLHSNAIFSLKLIFCQEALRTPNIISYIHNPFVRE